LQHVDLFDHALRFIDIRPPRSPLLRIMPASP
jgi:hypothetical protein